MRSANIETSVRIQQVRFRVPEKKCDTAQWTLTDMSLTTWTPLSTRTNYLPDFFFLKPVKVKRTVTRVAL